ncbi:MAG: 23S rRNA (uracil(1939)-C(5))-methyltransferase RlmD [Clostridiales bacterium]|nr:23S rRNA (uracil(1939)-C(5))-methyltransferase RlmD [Clostridiales bacterium]
MKKGDILEGIVSKTVFPNKGIIYIEEHKIIVKNALEGQKIRFSISKKRRDKIEGRLLDVLERSPLESVPQEQVCTHYGVCGGCAYCTLPYGQQLILKRRQVEDLIAGSGFDFAVEEILPSPVAHGYRNKMEFTFGDEEKDGPLALGMHRKNSFYNIVSLKDCHIADRDIITLLQAVLQYFTSVGATYYHKMRKQGYLRHLVVRRSIKTGDILINLVTTSQDTLDDEAFVQKLISTKIDGRIVGILHTRNDSVADVVQSDATRLLYGQDYFYEYLLNMRFKISPFSFFQTNTLGAEELYQKVREYAGDQKDKLIYDLYTGTGTIAQMMAPAARKVVGVEIVEEAVEAARLNAADNHLDNCEFIAGDVLKVLDSLEEKPDIIILDPPRDGVNPKALQKIIRYGVDEIVYVSCKPTSLMRDLAAFRDAGYEVRRCSLVDMFPGTTGVETVVQLSKGEINSKKVRVEFSLEDMDMSGFQKGATYGQIKEYVKEHTGLSVSSLYIAQIKQKYGIIERENYNKPKSENARQPQCPPEKEAVITEALWHFKMIEGSI